MVILENSGRVEVNKFSLHKKWKFSIKDFFSKCD